jgi:FlaA1/EpsC-like NDP-sugar epimerase
MKTPQHILITGAAGAIGSALTSFLPTISSCSFYLGRY